jgi:hypothetical protein
MSSLSNWTGTSNIPSPPTVDPVSFCGCAFDGSGTNAIAFSNQLPSEIYISNDHGKNWTFAYSTKDSVPRSVSFPPELYSCAISSNGNYAIVTGGGGGAYLKAFFFYSKLTPGSGFKTWNVANYTGSEYGSLYFNPSVNWCALDPTGTYAIAVGLANTPTQNNGLIYYSTITQEEGFIQWNLVPSDSLTYSSWFNNCAIDSTGTYAMAVGYQGPGIPADDKGAIYYSIVTPGVGFENWSGGNLVGDAQTFNCCSIVTNNQGTYAVAVGNNWSSQGIICYSTYNDGFLTWSTYVTACSTINWCATIDVPDVGTWAIAVGDNYIYWSKLDSNGFSFWNESGVILSQYVSSFNSCSIINNSTGTYAIAVGENILGQGIIYSSNLFTFGYPVPGFYDWGEVFHGSTQFESCAMGANSNDIYAMAMNNVEIYNSYPGINPNSKTTPKFENKPKTKAKVQSK